MATTTLERGAGPARRFAGRGAPGAALRSFYREFFADPILRDFYGDSGFANLGYWDEGVSCAAQAGDRLVDALLGLIPQPRGSILDVACGAGGSTRRLLRSFPAAAVTAIGVSPEQLAEAGRRAPGCRFEAMDASALRFADASFDNVLCVEAAFHFDTRERFLREALRVLRPGGWLALSDLLMTRGTPLVPAANHLRSLEEYAALLRRCGFVDVRVQDATRETWQSFRRRFTDFVLARASRFGSAHGVRDLLAANLACAFAIRAGLLAVARRP